MCILFLAFIFSACGTHGSIKGYQYPTKKENLQQAIMKVIKNNSNIKRDTSLDYLGSSPLLDHGDNYSAGDNYYNDIKHYVTLTITSGQDINDYTFRYYGPDEDWETFNNSEIFICYAWDKNHKGGSEGDGGITRKMTKQFTAIFEKEFIDKVDQELGLTHIDAE